jgi:hypothetical protein
MTWRPASRFRTAPSRGWHWLLTLLLAGGAASAAEFEADICVYGGTSGGVAAAVAAARLGKSVVLVHYHHHVGGMSASGLGVTDRGQIGSIGGIAREFYRRVGQVYGVSERFDFTPGVAEGVFQQLLAEAGVPVFTNQRIASVTMVGNRITSLVTEDGSVFRARMFLDTTYEGDLMAAAGVTFTVGREGTNGYGESLAGGRVPGGSYSYDPYVIPGNPASGLLPLLQPGPAPVSGQGDHRVQAYNFRLCLTTNATNKLAIAPPPNYSEAAYELAARYLEARMAADGAVNLGQLLHLQILPNSGGKTDINANGELSTDFVGASWTWATNTHAGRDALRQQHEDYIRGLLHFLATSARVPANVRAEMLTWGLAKDEFQDNGGWPWQIYVREARRMVADYVMTQHDAQGRAFAPDGVALASYAMDSHSVTRLASSGLARSEGGFFVNVPQPFAISYRSIVPSAGECENLFCTFALSASHAAFASCRMEPVFMMTSQSAATAAAQAIEENVSVQQVNHARLALQLRADGQLLDWTGGVLTTNGVIVDNGQPGAAQIGSWTSGANPGYWGTGYFHDQNSGKGSKSIRYTPHLPFSGDYDVFGWWVADPNRATNVPYDVVHATGTNRVLVNQTINGSRWVFLLRTNFTAGQGGGVILRNDGTTGFVIADAVRFMPVGPFTVPPPRVNVFAADPEAAEADTNRARFAFVRDGDLSAPLTIGFHWGGTASNGIDFATAGTNLTLAAGASSASLFIAPLRDGRHEGDETVTVTLRPGAAYALGDFTNATARLRDADPPRIERIEFLPDANSVVLTFELGANVAGVVQAAEGLVSPAWTNLLAFPASPALQSWSFTNGLAPEAGQRFYRLRVP